MHQKRDALMVILCHRVPQMMNDSFMQENVFD